MHPLGYFYFHSRPDLYGRKGGKESNTLAMNFGEFRSF